MRPLEPAGSDGCYVCCVGFFPSGFSSASERTGGGIVCDVVILGEVLSPMGFPLRFFPCGFPPRFFPCGFPLAGLAESFRSVDEGGFFRGFSLPLDSMFLSVNLTQRALVDGVALLAEAFECWGGCYGRRVRPLLYYSGVWYVGTVAGCEAPEGRVAPLRSDM